MCKTVEALEGKISDAEARLSALRVDRAHLAQRAADTIAEVDAALGPLDDEIRRGLDEGSRRAENVRAQRRELFARRSRGEALIRQWDDLNGSELRRLQESVNEWRREIPQAAFAELTDTDLEQAEKQARFRLQAAHSDLAAARDTLAHYRSRLAQAHEEADAEADAVAEHAELIGEREKLQADAYILERTPDAAKLADLDQRISASDKTLEQLKRHAEGARAAIPALSERIEEQQGKVDEAVGRVTQAEAAVFAAVRNRAVRQLAALVDGMREPLLILEAADRLTGQRFYQALTERGLHSINVHGDAVPPAWLPSIRNRPETYGEEVQAARGRILSAAGAVNEVL